VNNCFRNVATVGRVRTTEYKQWIRAADWETLAQRPVRVSGPVLVWIDLEDGASRADTDNHTKALLDLLVRWKIIEDDRGSIVRRVSTGWEKDVKGVRIIITPTEA
jgi:Holliday junction resolvase RusA-like endonuclease